MLRVLFDKNVPYLLRRHLIDYQVQTADDEGWGQVSNGELIHCAEKAGYQTMLTCELKRVSPGSFEFIEIAPPPKRRRLGDPST
jgi:hypothetical protein